MNKLKTVIVVVVLTMLCVTVATAQTTRTWVGAGNGGTGTDFNTAGNWSPSGVPGASDICNFTAGTPGNPTTITFSANITVGEINITSTQNSNNQRWRVDVGTRSVTVSGNVTVNNPGTGNRRHEIQVGSGTLTVGGNLVIGTGSGQGGSLIFTGAGTVNVAGNLSFGINGAHTTASGSTINLNGASQTLTQAVAAGLTFTNLTLSGSGTKTRAGTGGTTINGILSVNGTAEYSGTAPTYGAAATLRYQGSAAQTTGTEFPGTFGGSGGVVINNSAGVTLNATKSLGASSTLTLTSGVLSTGSNKVTVTNNAPGAVVITGGSINGEIERAIAASSTGIYQFTDDHTRITPNGSQGAITVSVKSFPNTFIPVGNPAYAIKRYYTITPSAALTGTLRMAYVDAELNGLTEALFSAWRYNGTAWVDEGGAPDPTNNWVEQTDISTWSDWTLAESGGPLPITLASFTATVVNGSSVLLDWTTISEVNNYGFYIQSRAEGQYEFADIQGAFVAGNGTTLEPRSYAWIHENVAPGSYEYRLRQVDLDGSMSFSWPVSVVIASPTSVRDGEIVPAVFKLNQNYPNPFNPSTKISFSLAEANFTTLKLYNVLGQEVATLFNGMADAGRMYVVDFDASHLGSGVYFYRLASGGKVEVRKMTLMK